MPDQIDEDTKRRRQNIIMEQQGSISIEINRKYIGKTIGVLCEGFDRMTDCYYGRSAADAPEVDGRVYYITNGKKSKIGDIVRVNITDSLDYDLMGILV